MTNKLDKEYLQQFLDDNTVEELIQESGKGEFKDPTVIKFCQSYSLKSGEIRVPSWLIYMVYRSRFTRVGNAFKVKPVAFFRTFKKLFTQTRSGNQRYYLLNTDFNLEPEDWDNFKYYYRMYYIKKVDKE